MLKMIKESADYIASKVTNMPEIAIILGSGLGDLASKIKAEVTLKYSEIPNFPVSTVSGHSGELIFGKLGEKRVMAMAGRFHYYEGYNMKQVTLPVRVMALLGIKTLIVSNAAGGMNPTFKVGDVMMITDHINLFPEHPLRGQNYDEFGPRFPSMEEAYSNRLCDRLRKIAKENDFDLKEGVYVGTQGPSFETPSEYRYFYRIGGDAVGMSTVPEVIVARHSDIEVAGFSVITDLGGEGLREKVSHEEVKRAAKTAEPVMTKLIVELIKTID